MRQEDGTSIPNRFKGVVDCFFSRLDYVYGVQSNMFMLCLLKRNTLFFT